MAAPTTIRIATADPARRGILLGLSAYMVWGFFPAYFKALAGAAPLEIVAHRIAWSALLLLLLSLLRGRSQALRSAFGQRRVLLTLCGSTLLIATNWLVFIYAVEGGEVLQSSLGYFINPLVSILLGFVFLGERLNRPQQVSLLLAAGGVLYLALQGGEVPWIALILAWSFGLYGLLRKIAQVDALIGLTVETLLLAPLATGYLVWLQSQGESAFLAGSLRHNLLLPLAGAVTALPLLCFAGAARRLRLATVGFLQYITPTLHFVLAVGLFGEPFSAIHLVSFSCIWAGLAIYTADALRQLGIKRSPGGDASV